MLLTATIFISFVMTWVDMVAVRGYTVRGLNFTSFLFAIVSSNKIDQN